MYWELLKNFKTIYYFFNLLRLCTYWFLTFFVIGKYLDSLYLSLIINLNTWLFNFLFNLILFLNLGYSFFNKNLILLGVYTSLKLYFFSCIKINLTYSYLSLLQTLWIGTISIHPLFLYIFITVFFIKLLSINNYENLYISLFNDKLFLIIGILALFLGGLWGFQSFTWGFLWVGDGIEWILFLFLFLFVYYIHVLSLLFTKNKFLFYFILALLCLIFIRLNLLTTRHSFIVTTPTNYIIFLILTIIIFVFIFTICFKSTYTLLMPKMILSVFFWFILKIGSIFTQTFSWIIVLSLILLYSKQYIFKKTILSVLHIIIGLSIILWIDKYPLFIGVFNRIFQLYLNLSINTYHFSLSYVSYCNKIIALYILEKLKFLIIFNIQRVYMYIPHTIILISLGNNYYYLFIVLILFLKRYESWLLFKKKTYF